MTITGTGISANTTVSSINTAGTNNNGTITISNNATANGTNVSFSFSHIYTGDLTFKSKTITNITTTNIKVGMTITGNGISDYTFVTVINTAGSNNNGIITISKITTANGTTISLTFITEFNKDLIINNTMPEILLSTLFNVAPSGQTIN
jgi:hypothetical protein